MPARKTTAEFVHDARLAHGNKYNYSLAVYQGQRTKIRIICPIHGVFKQNPTLHSKGKPHPSGCPQCGIIDRNKQITKNQDYFLTKARQKHGDLYDYSLAIYKSATTPIIIICPIHGQFLQRPQTHIKGHGCPECGRWKQGHGYQTDGQFIQMAKKVHGDKYDYSLTDYVCRKHQDEKIIIICLVHGQFLQRPQTHIEGHGCPECGRANKVVKMTKSQIKFIREARKVHGDKYDYSLVNYTHCQKEITIICPIHGQFRQVAGVHIREHGCRQCGDESRTRTTEEFIQEARVVHGGKYDYSLVNYETCYIKIKIICPIHGVFEQTPQSHLSGSRQRIGCGCPECFQDRNSGWSDCDDFVGGMEVLLKNA